MTNSNRPMNTQGRDASMKATIFATVAGLALSGSTLAQEEKTSPWWYNDATGQTSLNYPPDRPVDYIHMKLDLTIPDMNERMMLGAQTLIGKPLGSPLREISLDARLMEIASVSIEGHEVAYEHDGRTLSITIEPPIAVDKQFELVTAYVVRDSSDGFQWLTVAEEWPGRAAQIHTQGQPETNSYWFPCHDFPNERLTTEVRVTVPPGYIVSSNGRLADRGARMIRRSDQHVVHPMDAYEFFHWKQETDHVNYLVSLVVGKFDVVDLGTSELPMPVYVPPGRGNDARATYANTPRMVTFFENLFDEPYPWAQYAQLAVWNFGAGGMENTSATTMYDTAVFSPEARLDHDLDGLIAHELAHQWFGDLITCNSWEHIWLNEGFATYCSALWFGERDGEDGYYATIRDEFDQVIRRDQANAPMQEPMVSKAYAHPWEVFGRKANPYPKGASVLHMLRTKLGDELFFRGIASYVDVRKHTTVETGDFRRAMENTTGTSLGQFIEQWCMRPGVPEVEALVEWDAEAGALTISARQTQRIDGWNPAFVFDLPVWVSTPEGERPGAYHTLEMRGFEATLDIPLPSEPQIVAIDPKLATLAKLDIEQPESRWIAQLRNGPTLPARVQAARALAASDASDAAVEALMETARDSSLHDMPRVEAVEALSTLAKGERLAQLAGGVISDPHVRRAVIQALGRLAYAEDSTLRPTVASALRWHAENDVSQIVRQASLEAIGAGGFAEHLDVVVQATYKPSQHDRIRQSALRALRDLDAQEGIEAGVRLSAFGNLNRTRPVAISTLVALEVHDPELVYTTIAGLIDDTERRTWRSAGQALVNLGDPRAIEVLTEHRQTLKDPVDQNQVDEWIEALGGEVPATAAVP